MDLLAVLSGFGVGAIVGLTGVGGGSLMTPLLIGAFRLSPAVAIGTDLWFAAITKSGGAVAHHRHGHVDRRITVLLLAGSIPAAIGTLATMHATGASKGWSSMLTVSLGIALLLTAVTVAYKPVWHRLALRLEPWFTPARRLPATVACGAALGVLVSLTSIGAGALGATMILLLYPRLPTQRLVGTDIAHAVPLTLVAGIGHAWLGHVDWSLLLSLLIGSLPGIWLGAQMTRRLPEQWVRALLCVSLVTAGLKVIH
ncbi:MAG: sulfite exporter TauE/SafE family protein [Rubrivivax sp.]